MKEAGFLAEVGSRRAGPGGAGSSLDTTVAADVPAGGGALASASEHTMAARIASDRRAGQRRSPATHASTPSSPSASSSSAWSSWSRPQRLGAGWTSDGPGAGYFPFYIGLILCVCGVGILVQALRARASDDEVFVDSRAAQARAVGAAARRWSTCGAIQLLGLYVASALFIALFMIVPGQVLRRCKSVDRRRGRQRAVLRHVRGLVQGAAAQGPARTAALPRLLSATPDLPETDDHGRTRRADPRLRASC